MFIKENEFDNVDHTLNKHSHLSTVDKVWGKQGGYIRNKIIIELLFLSLC